MQINEDGSLTVQRYITDIIEQYVVPFSLFIRHGFLLMQEKARPHVAACVQGLLNTLQSGSQPNRTFVGQAKTESVRSLSPTMDLTLVPAYNPATVE